MPFLPLHDTSSTRYKQTKHLTVRFTSAGLPSLHNANPSTNGLHIHGNFFSHCSSSSALEVTMRKKPFRYCSVSSIQMWSLSQSWITRRDVHPICNSWRAWENPNNALSRYQASPKRLVPSFCYSLPVENLEWVFILLDSSFVFTEVDRSVSSTCSAVQACCLVLAPERFEESTVRKFRDELRMEKCIRSICTEVCFQSLF